MAKLELPVPFKVAVVGLTGEATPEVRQRILDAIDKAVADLDGVELHSSYFMFHNSEIKVVPARGE